MLYRLEDFVSEYEEVATRLSDPAVIADKKEFTDLSKRFKALESLVEVSKEIESIKEDIDTAKLLITGADPQDRELMRVELEDLQIKLENSEKRLSMLLVPADPNDGKNVIVSIRGAEGGEEANLFARVLLEMYLRWVDAKKWKVELLSDVASERGGVEEATFLVKGDDAWRHLKHEAGPHRVQRVPVTESSGRIHTSSAVVTVIPEVEDIEVEINDSDLKIDIYRSSGPGGQSVNTTDSAVRITHLPTGLVVTMQDERSQLQNKLRAMQVLRSRLFAIESDKRNQELSSAKKAQVGTGGRGDKIRTYNYKENRVTDHRISLTLYKLDKILLGDLDELSDALVQAELADQLMESAQ